MSMSIWVEVGVEVAIIIVRKSSAPWSIKYTGCFLGLKKRFEQVTLQLPKRHISFRLPESILNNLFQHLLKVLVPRK